MKPQMKREVGVITVLVDLRWIIFHGSDEAAKDFKYFGRCTYDDSLCHFTLNVDSRFDFYEVVKYVEKWSNEVM